jgi:SAM-dependent methyltransferase
MQGPGEQAKRMTATLSDTRFHTEQLAAMLGIDAAAVPASARATLAAIDLGYRVLTGDEREQQLLAALRASEADDLRTSGPHRAADWERGWDENLREFTASGDAAALMPKYNRHRVLRLGGQYVEVADARFEYAVYTALRQCVFGRWFASVDHVVEFGCGTGTSLMLLADLLPRVRLTGLDWAESSQRILGELAARTGRLIAGRRYDMFDPPSDLPLGPGTGVLSSAALEQIGERHEPLLARILAGAPQICVHIEPIVELYGDTLFDEVARRYHRRRNYLKGFLPRLQQLAATGAVEILWQHRTGLGSFHHEGYSVVVWRPRSSGRR